MRTLLISAMVAAFVVMLTVTVGGGSASADSGPHVQGAGATADGCAGCHRAHTAQAAKILVADQPALCYSCHGTGGTGSDLDVQNGEARTGSTALRGGGFDFALIDTDDATLPPTSAIGVLGVAAAVTSGHTIDGTAETVWGNGGINSGAGSSTFNLACGTCHDPHGNGEYRILRPSPPGSGGGGQNVTDEVTKVYDTTDYFDVSYLDASISGWCTQCHTRYLASSGAEGTDSGDAIFAYRHRSDGSGTAPTCLKCHTSHGTNAVTTTGGESEGVPWPDGAGASGENSRLLRMDNRGICQKCHNQ